MLYLFLYVIRYAVSVSVVACTAELSVESSGTDSLSLFNEVGVIIVLLKFSLQNIVSSTESLSLLSFS